MAQRNVKVGAIKDISGEVNIAGGDIVKNITTIYQRALTAVEEASRARKLESKLLAQGVAMLVQSLSAQASQSTESDSPYKGLLPYSLNEAEIFYGRNKAKKDLLNHIKQSPLTVLHAESGAGKSSLLQAGIAAQLIANGHLAIYLRPHNADPVEFIKRMFLPELIQAPALAGASLREFLRQVCAVLGSRVNLYLLLDQFEEFFRLKKDARQPFLESLADCLNDPSLKVRWVLALRKEALSDLAELESFGITQFKNTYRLDRLGRAEAQEAMVEPARRYDIIFGPALIEHILDTLTTNDEVRPTDLQLVCSALTDDLPEDKTLTLAYYTEHEGGTEGILRDYLKRQLEDLPAGEQALAWKVLRALITADRQRAVKTFDEIIQELKTSGASKKQIETILGRLVERRLLFTQTQPATEEMFELAHDYLIKEIELDPQEQALKAAQELLDQETRAYQRHKTLLTAERLAVIEPHQNELRLSSDSEALLDGSRKAVQEEQRLRERRRNITVGISLAVALVMTLLAVWGFRSSQVAKQQANHALARQLVAQAQSINATGNTKQVIAILLATQSMKLFPLSDATEILWNTDLGPRSISRIAHEDAVTTVAFSPDGKYVASGSDDSTARVWETSTGKEIGRMTHDGRVTSVAFSPDGKYVASGSDDFTARVWETSTGKEIARMDYDFWVNSVAFSPDGKYVVSGSADGTARIWETSTGKEAARMTHEYDVTTVAFSPDGKYVVSGSDDFTGRVWEVATGKEVARMTHDSYVTSVAFSTDGNYIVSGSWDHTARVWETSTGKEIARMNHENYVQSVAFSPDGRYVASGSDDFTARVWEISTGKEVTRMTYDGAVTSIAYSPDGKYVLSGSQDGTARVWQVLISKPAVRMTQQSPVNSIAFSPDGTSILSGSSDGSVILWEMATGRETTHMRQEGLVNSVAFSPDGKYMLSSSRSLNPGGSRNTVIVWEATTSKEVSRITYDDYSDILISVAFSPDGQYVVSGSLYGTVLVWDAATGKEVARITQDGSVNSVALSPDGIHVITGGCEYRYVANSDCVVGTVRVWEASTGREIARITHDSSVISVAFGPDGKYVVSGGWDGTAIVWEAGTGKEIARLAHHGVVAALAFSSDGKTVLSGECQETSDYICIHGTVRIWKAATGREIIHMPMEGAVSALVFSRDGKYVLLGGCEEEVSYYRCVHGTVRVWEAATGKEIAHMAQDGAAIAVAFSPDGKYVASGSWENAARIWMWRSEDLIADTCSRLNHNLTRGEWERYIGDALPYQAVCSSLPVEPAPRVVVIHNMNEYYGWILLWVTMLYIVSVWIAYRAIFLYPGSPSRLATSAFTWKRFVIAGAQGALLITLILAGLFVPTWLIWDQMLSGEFSPSPFVILFLLPAGLWAGGAYSHFTRFQSGRWSRMKRTLLGSLAGLFGLFVWSLILMLLAILLFERSISIGDYFWVEMLQIATILGGISGVLSAIGALIYVFGIQKWIARSVTHKQASSNHA